MERQQILNLYEWRPGTCFRHPDRGVTHTTLVKIIQPRDHGPHEIRACEDCVILMEDVRREAAARSGSEYRPGHAGEPLE